MPSYAASRVMARPFSLMRLCGFRRRVVSVSYTPCILWRSLLVRIQAVTGWSRRYARLTRSSAVVRSCGRCRSVPNSLDGFVLCVRPTPLIEDVGRRLVRSHAVLVTLRRRLWRGRIVCVVGTRGQVVLALLRVPGDWRSIGDIWRRLGHLGRLCGLE
ncbi:hypothetical protein BDV93DRAFT_525495 [Ceratobasidium sp. AG-I]|nr:hypothetical protein BDV93DRAFT_525495 [Ceratobasidium sp. AG-I]